MGVAAGPKVVTEGLVFSLDARNSKTYDDIPGITDHGISDWYCFVDGTTTYSAIYPNTEIIEIDADGNETVMVSTGSDPQRGTFTTTAGRRYYGTKAIHLLDEGVNDAIAPISFAGTYFGNYHSRNDPKIVNIYAPQDDINVNVYENVVGGVTGAATTSFSVSKGTHYEYIFYGKVEFTLAAGGSEDYEIGETIDYEWTNTNNGVVNNTTATVVEWDSTNRKLLVNEINPDSRFGAGGNNFNGSIGPLSTFTGQTSGASYNFSSFKYVTTILLETDKPAIMTVGSGADDHILMPMTNYVYKRRNQVHVTINNTTPSNNGTYVSYDTSLPLFTLEIADGAGGDSTQGIGYEYLSDTYSWGDLLSDFALVSPYADNVVNVSYWLNNQWNLGGSYSLNGTQTSPAAVYRNGPGGFDVDGTTIDVTSALSGNYANFNNSTLWKFEGTQPFALIINDTADDEERLLGWMSNKYLRTSSNVTQSFVNLIDKDDRSRMKIYGTPFNSLTASDYIEFDGANDYTISSAVLPAGQQKYTISAWWKTPVNNRLQVVWEQNTSTQQANTRAALLLANNNWGLNGQSNDAHDKVPVRINQWTYGVITVDTTLGTNPIKIYENGFLYWQGNTSGGASNLDVGTSGGAGLGRKISTNSEYFIGTIAQTQIYDRVLTAQEIQQNFNALRGRFSI